MSGPPPFDTRDVICTRCITPGRGWTWDATVRCEPCHRAAKGDVATDELILSDYGAFREWWTDEFLERLGGVSGTAWEAAT